MLSLELMGDMEVSRDGERLALPQSKKTRALLAYLAVTGRPHRRDRLCSLFWEMPDDPRGSLRWSLSKLRPLVDEPGRRRIVADRESVRFDAEGVDIDVLGLTRRCGDEPSDVDTPVLELVASTFRGDFLEGIELATCPDFQAWCVAERERVRLLQRRVLEALVARLADQPARGLIHARRLVQLDPLDEEARAGLIRLVGQAGHREEAARHYDDGLRLLDEAGIRSTGLLKAAWRDVKALKPVPSPSPDRSLGAQQIAYCTTGDGMRIAYSTVGQGPPIVKAANWLNHLEFDWESPVWRHWLKELTRGHQLIRYDERGNGMSDWDAPDLSLDAFVSDLEAVVDATGVERFTLFGVSHGCAVSIAYAARHPHRVERLILYGGYPRGWRARGSAQEIAEREAVQTLLRQGWGQKNPAFRRMFTSRYIPDGTPEQVEWFNNLQRRSASAENAARLMNAFGDIDVSALLADVATPALVVHARDDAVVPYTQAEALAQGLPNARLVALDSRNHLVLEHEPAWSELQTALRGFLDAPVAGPSLGRQRVQYCTTGDGVRIAYSAVGTGPPIVKAANWLNHLEFDWESPVWRHWLRELTRGHRLIRYDERGNGLSDWAVEDLSLDAFVRDLEAVVDASGLDRFSLFGISQGCAVSIAYAVRHPERVERMILYGGYAKGWRSRADTREITEREAILTLVRQGWGRENPAFRQLFTSRYIPDGTPEQMQWFNDLQRITTSPENAARLMAALGEIDVSSLLAQVRVPTLVLHCRHDAGVPFAQGEVLAKSIPGARFVPLDSRNHVMLEHEPAWPHLQQELRGFLGEPLTQPAASGGRDATQVETEAAARGLPTAEAPMIGRNVELAQLRRILAETSALPRARMLLLTGEVGLGKTRLLAEIAAATRAAGGTVLEGSADEVEGGRPFAAWIDALRRLHPAAMDAALGDELAPLLPELASGAGDDSSRDRLFGAVAELIGARARSAPPVLLAFDDAQWLDAESAALLHHVTRLARQRPVLIVLAARAGELDENATLSRVVRTLRREIPVDSIALAPLSPTETAQLVGAVAPGIDARRVYAESDGNPLFALEVARALRHRSDELPLSLAELVRDRVARLPDTAADILRWAAVLGPGFDQERLGSVAGVAPEALVTALETLQRHGLLRHDESARRPSPTYVFAHDLVRRAIHGDISAARRRLMHGRVAGLLAKGADDGETAAEIIHHAEAAGETALAAHACIGAARRCLRLFANADAAALVRRGLALAATLEDPERVKLTLELKEVSFAVNRPETFDDSVAELEDLAGRALDHGCLEHARLGYQLMGLLRWEGGNWSDARRQMMQAELVSRSTDERGRVLGMSEAARCLTLLERDLPEAEAMLLEAEAIAKRIGVESMSLLDARGMLRQHRGDLDEAASLFDQARMVARRDGDRRAEFAALEHRAMIDLQRGRYLEARGLCQDLLNLGEKLREGSEAPLARALCALTRYALSDRDEGEGDERARERLHQTLMDLRLVDAKQRLSFVLMQAALVELDHDAAERASALAEEAAAVAEALGRPSDVARAHAIAARCAQAALHPATFERHLAALRRMSRETLSAPARAEIDRVLAAAPATVSPMQERLHHDLRGR